MSVAVDFLKSIHTDSSEIEESGVETYSSLEAAQEAALPPLATVLAGIISQRLDTGEYIVENGVVRSKREVCCE